MDNKFFDATLFALDPAQLQALGPYLWLSFGIAVCTVCAALKVGRHTMKVAVCFFLIPYFAALMMSVGLPSQHLFGTSLEVDALTRIVGAAVGVFAFVSSLFASNPISDLNPETHSEWGALLLTSVLGMSLLPGARDLVAFFVYLETLAIAGYIMTALDTYREKSLEAGLKYLLLGAFASALFLMGATLLYGLVGTFDFDKILQVMPTLVGFDKNFAIAGALLMVSSLLFKVALVPFHMWAPDVYQAGPTALVGFLASATKISVFAATAVLLNRSGLIDLPSVRPFIHLLAIASIFGGSFMAIAQTQVRRLFAYSSVANAGYAALALCAGAHALGSMMVFLLIYGGTLICVFAIVEVFSRALKKEPHSDILISDLGRASNRCHPFISGLFAFAIFSIAGIPPMPGFFGKYLVLKDLWMSGLDIGSYALILGTLLGLAYYLKLLVPLYMENSETKTSKTDAPTLAAFAALLAALVSVLALSGLSRLPEWIHSVEGLAR